MDTLQQLLNFVLHIDNQLLLFVTTYGSWAYALLFLIIFCETGLVITPFLPGDSLLFAAGAIAASTGNALDINLLFALLVLASIAGNSVNYQIGRFIGPKVFHSTQSRWFNYQHLQRAHAIYEKFGGKMLIIARFMPIVRTFAPFVAGIAAMGQKPFFIYNIVSAILWIGSLLYISYWFGNIPIVKEHFSLVAIGIIVISLLPVLFELIKRPFKATSSAKIQ